MAASPETAPVETTPAEGTPSPERPYVVVVDSDQIAQRVADKLRQPKGPEIKTVPNDLIAELNLANEDVWKKKPVDETDEDTAEGFATGADYTDNAIASLETWEAEMTPVATPAEAVHAVGTTEKTIAFRGLRGWFHSVVEARRDRVEHRRRFYRSLGASALDFAYSPLGDNAVGHMDYEKPRNAWERLYERLITRSAQSARSYNEEAAIIAFLLTPARW